MMRPLSVYLFPGLMDANYLLEFSTDSVEPLILKQFFSFFEGSS
jgi:hypothetical protein